MTSFMKELKPDSIEDIIAGISLYRPGPMAEIPRYIECKKNPDKVQYETPELENVLNVTYGVMVYQEQVMEIVRKLAGYSMGRSDMVRRAMSKKKHKVMEEERKNFIHGIIENDEIVVPGCIRNGISEENANKIFDNMMDFASYAFNKSHAAAYAVVGYQTAYLMKYYPVEMIAAMLNSVMGINEKIAYYIAIAEELGIQVLPPNINESFSRFTVKGDKIRFGLAAIKNVGGSVVDSIVKARESKGKFESLVDFINKMDPSTINKRAVECLIKAGALDDFKVFRSKMLAVHEKMIDNISSDKKRNIDGQISLFATEELKNPEVKYPEIKEFNKRNLLAMEKEMTGLYITGHPLDDYAQSLKMQTTNEISKIFFVQETLDDTLESDIGEVAIFNNQDALQDNDRVILGGILASVNQKVTRNNSIMAFLKLEDLTGTIEVIVFPKTLDKVKELCVTDSLVIVKGRLSLKEDEPPKLICESIEPLEKMNTSKVYLRVEDTIAAKELNKNLRELLIKEYLGDTPIYIFASREKQKFRVPRDRWVSLESDVIGLLKETLGEENVKIQDI